MSVSHTQEKPAQGWFGAFKQKIGTAYQGLSGYVIDPLKRLFGLGQSKTDKERLADFRADYAKQYHAEVQNPHPDFVGLTKVKSDEFRAYIQNIVAQEVKRLGKPPCAFSLVGLGSLARQECGPVTDLEIGFCIQEKTVESYKYFYKLSQRLADRLFLLGEHPDLGEKGLRLDEADNAPPYLKFFARNATPEQAQKLLQDAIENREFDKIPFAGSRAFIGTPDDFAGYAASERKENRAQLREQRRQLIGQHIEGKSLSQKQKNEIMFWINQITKPLSAREKRVAIGFGTQLGRNTTHVFGDQALYDQFINRREPYLQQKDKETGLVRRQLIARNKLLKEDISGHIQKGTSLFLEGRLDKTLDIKRELYRFVEQFVTNLGFYYKSKNQNCLDIVNELTERKVITSELAAQLKDYLQFAMGLRLKKQTILGRQGFATYLSEEKFQKDKEDFEEKIAGMEQAIAYLEMNHGEKSVIDAKKRQLFKSRQDYQHMLEMAPGKILSAQDIQLLESKYAPMAKAIFDCAQAWVKDPNALCPRPESALKVSSSAPVSTPASTWEQMRIRLLNALYHAMGKPVPSKQVEPVAELPKQPRSVLPLFGMSKQGFKKQVKTERTANASATSRGKVKNREMKQHRHARERTGLVR